MIVVKAAEYMQEYCIRVTFSDGVTKTVDLASELTGPMFQLLQDKTLFSQLSVDPDSETIVWPNGADIAPEYLYERGKLYNSQQNA
jgi:hypothetical protein